MTAPLKFSADWELLASGAQEERACFAALGICAEDVWLTEAEDQLVNTVRQKVHLSAYRLAEWFASNWWRLRWEPRNDSESWALAHRIATVGGGYIWPNVTIFSDGERIVLLSDQTRRVANEPLRYLNDFAGILRASEFESAIDLFIELVRARLYAEGVVRTNLEIVWEDVLKERQDPLSQAWRRFEALVGLDPDEGDSSVIEGLIRDSDLLGRAAMNEVAATSSKLGRVVTAEELDVTAKKAGYGASPGDAVKLADQRALPTHGAVAAWRRGAMAAKFLREQERLHFEPIGDAKLAELAGVEGKALSNDQPKAGAALSFALDDSVASGSVVFRPKWKNGRRFDLARLLGDRVMAPSGSERLFPVTRTSTYRQKEQRAFAAELLSPFEALEDFLAGDFSEEKQHEAAEFFQVSDRQVRTMLVNYGRIDRGDLFDHEHLEAEQGTRAA